MLGEGDFLTTDTYGINFTDYTDLTNTKTVKKVLFSQPRESGESECLLGGITFPTTEYCFAIQIKFYSNGFPQSVVCHLCRRFSLRLFRYIRLADMPQDALQADPFPQQFCRPRYHSSGREHALRL